MLGHLRPVLPSWSWCAGGGLLVSAQSRRRRGIPSTVPATIKTWKIVTVRTGNGSSTTLNRIWGQDYYVRNNSGDEAALKNASGTLIYTCSVSAVGSGPTGR